MATVWDEAEQDGIGEEVLKMSTEEIIQRTRLLDSEIKIMKSEVLRVTHELQAMKDKIKENSEKIKVNKTLPYLVSNVIEDYGALEPHITGQIVQLHHSKHQAA
ncbi:26S protease regulatory subunit 6A [Myotis davidii]|uniref:26S protease regulatory subunit 6A n=1 Tax=Myotis davidii TaxID=225400 RepID=L5LU18_MYODS|nr:26S protease regulatory subunit 6A [Myotis davidii]